MAKSSHVMVFVSPTNFRTTDIWKILIIYHNNNNNNDLIKRMNGEKKMNWIENKYGISIFTAKCVHNILSHVPGHLEVSFVVCILSSDWTA